MNPLIFQFKETPSADNLDFSNIEYDATLNLNVDKQTRRPAIDELRSGTETFTRMNEGTDSDKNVLGPMMATCTATKVSEESDIDPFVLSLVMATETVTTAQDEGSDSDIDPPELPL